ncbi:hypothetical protein [Nocardioides luteus]|uniref:hypothetical protein n=1 Tax=Nocardioides luteus TaxID=1844 RepID=UPI00115FAFDA|nr:hypothetical protein [Nocardioides luteus]
MAKWTLELVEDLDVPGWIPVPEKLTPPECEQWIASTSESLGYLVGTPRWDGEASTSADIRALLQMSLVERERSDAYALFQVWPVMSAAAVTCHLYVVETESLPDVAKWGGILHAANAAHIGPGVQLSARNELLFDGGVVLLESVNYLFTDGEVSLLLGVDDCIPQLATSVVRGLSIFKDLLRMVREDGKVFESVLLPDAPIDESWPIEEIGAAQ